jgi:hypothetical protein
MSAVRRSGFSQLALLLIGASVVTLLVLAGAFFVGAVPDLTSMTSEPIAISMLKRGAGKTSFERFLRASGTSWHIGYGYQDGEAFSAFDLASREPCEIECRSVVQAAFTKTFGICTVYGDVVSIRYDENGKLKRWNLSKAVDGC